MGGRKEKRLNGREEREEIKWDGGKRRDQMGGRKEKRLNGREEREEIKWEGGKRD